MLSKRNQGIHKLQKIEPDLLCPNCEAPLIWKDNQISCANQHTFDVAKQGYLNLAPQHHEIHYTKELFQARQTIMGDLRLYEGLYSVLLNLITPEVADMDNVRVLDLGCGEGSHLQLLHEHWTKRYLKRNLEFIGLDLAKDGITTAAKYYQSPLWLVADLSHIPFSDNSMDGVLSILSPSNYKEIKRVLKKETGWFIKVIPGTDYLKELRERVLPESQIGHDPTSSLTRFHDNFCCSYKQETLYQRLPIEQDDLQLLINMTPLMWHVDEETITQILNEINQITIDLIVLFAMNKN
ncbi:putative RNA methyltransferase [Amphibacillus sp. Q70]|uniref:putative RNA methyltransferase n=1 Tax=Amphibacillus sp. Q70 TaxID=3453416 RepID=UPI003F8677D4